MSPDVKVRAVRPHDTASGMKQPGDEYERPAAEADALAGQRVVEIITPAAGRKRAAK